ncbi:MAG: thioredoxin domain-containing protein, partial [Pseudomonadota bacterium]|nr:thioredoxin domain-containing protein [Pseudomonadota bacterium]
ALSMLGEHGGWPLTMFLTPRGEPFWGGTYFPPAPRFGRPGFGEVLRSIHDVYRREPDKVTQNCRALATALDAMASQPGGGDITLADSDQVAHRLLAEVDPAHGGLGNAPKFPQVMALELMWRAWRRGGGDELRAAVLHTVDRMCQGGIYDHLGGGFARYAVDERWLVPHFEKMLYDNALLLELLAQSWQHTRWPLFKRRAAETAAWVLRDMIAPEGGFASAFDADSEGVEGKFYVWTSEEIDRLLGDDAAAFKTAYDVRPSGNWEGHTILNRSHVKSLILGDNEDDTDDHEAALAGFRERLLEVRLERVPPLRDDKVLADWNGLMISALAQAGAMFDRSDWIAAAAEAFAFVRDNMTLDDRSGDRLGHAYRAHKLGQAAFIDDYATLARAAWTLFEVTGDGDYLTRAEAWVAVANEHYWDDGTGGYFFTADDGEDLIVRTRNAFDAASPSGNGMMVGVLARLYAVTAKSAYGVRAEAVVAAFAGDAARSPGGACALHNGNELLRTTVQVVLVGEGAETEALRRVVFETNAPNRVLMAVSDGNTLPEGHPAAGKTAIDGAPTAHVCRGATCSLPITEPDELRTALKDA